MFEPIQNVCPATLRQSGLNAFQKRYSLVNVLMELKFSRHFRAMLVCAILLSALTAGKAQSGGATGTIVGSVVDSTGAVIPGAQVSIAEADTNVTQQTTTSAAGTYSVASLKPGIYRVTVAAKGFSTTTALNVELTVGSEARVDLKLAPGSEQQTVNVNAEEVSLDTENGAIGQVVTGEEIVDLPLNGRNFTQLLLLNSGAVSSSGEQGSLRANEGGSLTIQGSRPTSNQYFLDGININDTYYQTPAVVPSIDILQEFQ